MLNMKCIKCRSSLVAALALSSLCNLIACDRGSNQPPQQQVTSEPAQKQQQQTSVQKGGDLLRYFQNNKKRLIHRWVHYFEIYERHFARFRNRKVTIVEIGVGHGGSLQMWKEYFGPKARIIGVDINPKCKQLEEPQIEIYIGDQADSKFLATLREKIPEKIDILIDDGGHTMTQQISTYRELFPHISENGIYACEDLHTSYWDRYGGGFRRPGTFIEMSKELVDELNAWHFKEPGELSAFTKSAQSMHYYDSILVIEKRPMHKSKAIKTGKPSF